MNRYDLLTLAGAATLAAAELLGDAMTPREPRAEAASVATHDAPNRSLTLAAGTPASPAVAPPADPACPALDVPLPEVASVGDDPPIPDVEDPTGAMARFYDRLAATLRRTTKDPVRIAVYGDSNGTQDFVTGEMRRKLQAVFGDAGHGYVALVRPWNYHHMDVRYGDDGTWMPYNATTKTTADARYGHAFIAAFGGTMASRTWVATAAEGATVGGAVSRFDIAYLAGPWYGGFDAVVDGAPMAHVSANAPAFETRFARVDVADGPHRLEIRGANGTILLFGAALERDAPGAVVDGLGVGSMNCICMLAGDPEAFDATLRRRAYDLVVVHLGTNLFLSDKIAPCMTKAIARFRRVLPDTPVMLMSPYDRIGYRNPPQTAQYIRDAAVKLHATATAAGQPFFDFRLAMGGEASFIRFEKNELTLPGDDVHLNERGGAYMGDRVTYALVKGLRAHLATHPRAGCP